MAKLVALEWDSREARIAVAHATGGRVVVEQAFSLDLAKGEAGATAGLAGWRNHPGTLALRDLGRGDVLVAVGRANLELRTFTVPPAPDDELADLVRFQAPRHFSSFDENWALDFREIGPAGAEGRTVLAAALAPETIRQIRETCGELGLAPKRLVLRPFAAASLVCRQISSDEARVRLLVDPLADEVDLTVIVDGQVVFPRTTRLPGEPDSRERTQGLVDEMRRTILAARNQLAGRQVESIILCGRDDDHAAVRRLAEEQLALPVESIDPFSACDVAPDLARRRPEHAGRYAPLLGLLLDEAHAAPHAIDFLNPRKRPEPPNRRRERLWLGGVAATLALVIGFGLWARSARIDARLRDLQARSTALDKELAASQPDERRMTELRNWLAGDVNWLDELARVSRQLPPGEEAIVAQLRGSTKPNGGGQLALEGFAHEASTVIALEQAVRDARHPVAGGGSQENPERESLPFSYSMRIDLPAASDGATNREAPR